MSRVSVVQFANRQGLALSGILHEPDPATARGVCVLLLSPGIKGRVGPHRLYLKIADRLVPRGFHVFRFDYHGLGDSTGVLDEKQLPAMYNTIQSGRYVDDTRAGMDWMAQTHGIKTFVGSGLCGGSISGLLTAAVDDRIRSMLCLGIPTAFEGAEEHWGRYLTRGQLDQLRAGYLQRLMEPSSWARFLSGKSSYDVIWKSFRRLFKADAPAKGPAAAAPAPAPAANAASAPVSATAQTSAASPPQDNTNPKFGPAFLSVLNSGRPALLIFSGGDRLGAEFQEKFAERHQRELARVRDRYEMHTIDGANHVLSEHSWIDEFLDVSCRWLDVHHPARR
jgi:pimeloyl-ACP methyl ester carboxylesterase